LIEGPKLLNFKIGGPISQNDENRETKTAIKPKLKGSVKFHSISKTFRLIFIFNQNV